MMKKRILAIGLICMLGLCGCGQTNDIEQNSSVMEEGLQASQSSEKEEPATLVKETPETPTVSPAVATQPGFAIDQERLIPNQTFDVNMEGWGEVQFVAYQPKAPKSDVEFVLYRQGTEAYILPDAWNTGATFLQVQAVAFKDYNEDGKTDIITICEYSDNYEEEIYNVSVVYLQTEQGFEIDPLHHEYLQKNQITNSIDDIMDSHEDYLDYVTSLSGGYKGVDAQIRIMVKQKDLWLKSMDYANDLKKYTVTDLDNNGRLEIIVVNYGGTGNYTYSRYYEVNESYDGLVECTMNYVEGDSQPDLLCAEEITVYKDAQGINHYIVQDAIRDVTEYYFIWYDLTLQESRVTWDALATCHESYANAAEGAVVSYTTAEGEVITEAEFNNIPEKVFAENIEKNSMVWGWKDMMELQVLSSERLQEVLTEAYVSKLPFPEKDEISIEGVVKSNAQHNIEETDSAWHLNNRITIENPSWEAHYVAEGLESDTQPYELKLLKKIQNNITDDEEWLERNELSLQSAAMDKEYTYQVGDYATLYLYKNGVPLVDLDFVEYQYANEALSDEEKDWVTQNIRYALVEDNILYVSSYHYTYAETEPLNAYITAVDLTSYEVLWKTAPLTCNSVNFEIVGDVIFCGYGFTAEEDYLYQLDKKTGEILSKEKVKSQPEYIIYKEDYLYVRTYNTDYVYTIPEAELGLDDFAVWMRYEEAIKKGEVVRGMTPYVPITDGMVLPENPKDALDLRYAEQGFRVSAEDLANEGLYVYERYAESERKYEVLLTNGEQEYKHDELAVDYEVFLLMEEYVLFTAAEQENSVFEPYILNVETMQVVGNIESPVTFMEANWSQEPSGRWNVVKLLEEYTYIWAWKDEKTGEIYNDVTWGQDITFEVMNGQILCRIGLYQEATGRRGYVELPYVAKDTDYVIDREHIAFAIDAELNDLASETFEEKYIKQLKNVDLDGDGTATDMLTLQRVRQGDKAYNVLTIVLDYGLTASLQLPSHEIYANDHADITILPDLQMPERTSIGVFLQSPRSNYGSTDYYILHVEKDAEKGTLEVKVDLSIYDGWGSSMVEAAYPETVLKMPFESVIFYDESGVIFNKSLQKNTLRVQGLSDGKQEEICCYVYWDENTWQVWEGVLTK